MGSRPRPRGLPSTHRGRSSPHCPTCPRVPPRRSTCPSDSASSTTREAAPRRSVPTLGLTSVPDIDSGGITVDSQNNFILAVTNSSLYGGGPGIVHINSALTAFLADPIADHRRDSDRRSPTRTWGERIISRSPTRLRIRTRSPASCRYSAVRSAPRSFGSAYGIDQISFTGPGGTTVTGDGSGQTIAIVEEGVDPTLGADLTTFDQFFGIPAPPSFQVVDQNGVTTQNVDIVGEASLDVEWAHAVAPGASIIVYNAAYEPNNATASFENLIEAMQQASQLPGVSVVTLSYGEPESSLAASGLNEQSFDSDFTTPGVTFLAASGDSGIYGDGGYAGRRELSGRLAQRRFRRRYLDRDRLGRRLPGDRHLGRSRLGRWDAERDATGAEAAA